MKTHPAMSLQFDADNNHWKHKCKKYVENAPFYLGAGDGVCANAGCKATNLNQFSCINRSTRERLQRNGEE